MGEQTTYETVAKIIKETLVVACEDITPTTSFERDMGADELDMVELIMEVEREFGIRITDEVADGIVTVENLVKVVDELRNKEDKPDAQVEPPVNAEDCRCRY